MSQQTNKMKLIVMKMFTWHSFIMIENDIDLASFELEIIKG
jgi:hypothetical protein